MKSGLVSRGPPRSSTTMERPVSASCLARMPPVQPSPTMTMSADLSFVAMVLLSLAQILDRLRFDVIAFVAIFLDHFAIHSDRAGKADHLPHRAVAIAPVYRIGKIPFHGVLKQEAEESARGYLGEFRLSGFDILERRDAIGG